MVERSASRAPRAPSGAVPSDGYDAPREPAAGSPATTAPALAATSTAGEAAAGQATAGAPSTPSATSAEARAGIGLGPLEPERTWLDERSWVDVVPGWVTGADPLYDVVLDRLDFAPSRVFRYDHWVEEPHVGASFGPSTAPHPVLVEAQRRLQHHYGVRLVGTGVVLYRGERDGMAFHRDRDMQWLDDTLVALVVLGARRPFHLRPRANRYAHEAPAKGATHEHLLGHGDLIVLGGAVQQGWEHGVPQLRRPVGGRLSVQWRWTSRTGRQERGGSYRKPRRYGS